MGKQGGKKKGHAKEESNNVENFCERKMGEEKRDKTRKEYNFKLRGAELSSQEEGKPLKKLKRGGRGGGARCTEKKKLSCEGGKKGIKPGEEHMGNE